jgi:hypothetical protein
MFTRHHITGFRNWIHNWKQGNWKTSQGLQVKNAGIIRCISLYLDIRGRRGQKVVLEYVKGHSGDTGNDGADLMANHGAVLPIQPERNWEALERELEQQLAKTDFHGEPIATSEVLGGPFGDLPESPVELPKKVRKTSSQKMATSTSQKTIMTTTKTVTSPSPDPESKSRHILVHSSSQERATIRESSQPATSSTTQISKTSSYSHVWNESDKAPLKVVYVAPSLLEKNTEEIDFSVCHLILFISRTSDPSLCSRCMQTVYCRTMICLMNFLIHEISLCVLSCFCLSCFHLFDLGLDIDGPVAIRLLISNTWNRRSPILGI